MSVDKYSKHQRSKHPKVVATERNGTIHKFKSVAEYENSDLRNEAKKVSRRIKREESLNE